LITESSVNPIAGGAGFGEGERHALALKRQMTIATAVIAGFIVPPRGAAAAEQRKACRNGTRGALRNPRALARSRHRLHPPLTTESVRRIRAHHRKDRHWY
jgi:hypothetical protein